MKLKLDKKPNLTCVIPIMEMISFKTENLFPN